MHTLRKSGELYEVVYSMANFYEVIEPDLCKDQAMRLVNYLNGGKGENPPIMQDPKGSYEIG